MYTSTRNEWEEEGKIALIKETYTRTRNFVLMLTYTPHRRITKTRTNTLATHTHSYTTNIEGVGYTESQGDIVNV